MSKKDIPRLVARRTPEIETLLQDIWRLQPDIADRCKLTIYLSLGAFARELRGTPRLSPAVKQALPTTLVTETQPTEAADVKKHFSEEAISPQKANKISDDVEWD